MSVEAYIWQWFKGLTVLSFAVWTWIGALNNIIGFRSSAAALSRTMSMQPLREPPEIDSPLSGRAVASPRWAVVALVSVLIVQFIAALALCAGGVLLILSCLGGAPSSYGVSASLAGLTLLTLLWFGMLIGGLWFGYWIRQEGLQLTHIALLVLSILAAKVIYG